MSVFAPWAAWWGRMSVEGLDALPRSGPVLLAGNHDGNMDPVAVGVAARKRRQVRALAKAKLSDVRGLAPILDRMGQVPILRGEGDTGLSTGRSRRSATASASACFRRALARSGARCALAAGSAGSRRRFRRRRSRVLSISGTTDYARFPKRPRVTVRFFAPAGGDYQLGEDHGEFAARLLEQIRAGTPPVAAGRNAKAIERLRRKRASSRKTSHRLAPWARRR